MSLIKAEKLAELTPRLMNAFQNLGRQHPSHEKKLSIRQIQVLMILQVNGTLSLSLLCEKMGLAPSTGTELVNRMISLKLIKKQLKEKDQRHVELSLAPKGFELLEKRHRGLTKMFTNFMQPFNQQDQDDFVASFEKLWEIISKYYDPLNK